MTQPDSIPVCGRCQDEGWVCENHPNEAWPSLCQCGAGMPCPNCNSPPKELRPIKQTTDSITSAEEFVFDNAIAFEKQKSGGIAFFNRHELVKAITSYRETIRNAALEEAIDAVRGEFLADNTGVPEDIGHGCGLTDAISAIRSLKIPSKEG